MAVALLPGPAAAAAPGPDLEVDASAGGELSIGVAAERSVTVTNVGTETARDVHVVVELPTGVRFATTLPSLDDGTCTVVSVGTPAGQALFGDCRRTSLAAGATVILRMPIIATEDAACGPLTTPVRVSAANEPLANADTGNSGMIADRLACGTAPGPDLAISVRTGPSRPLPGRALVTYRIEITNRGDATAHDASASIALPGGIVVHGTPRPTPGGRCTMSSSWVPPGPVHMAAACSFETLDPGDVAVVTVSGRVPADPRCGDVTAVAKAEADDEPRELRGDENRAVATSTFACRPRIRISAHAPSAAHAGATVPVTVRVRNVSGASIVDVRPRIAGCGGDVRRLTPGDRVLDPRERWTFGCRRSVPAGADPVVVPIAITARDGARQVASRYALRRIDVWHPAIAIDVSSSSSVLRPGTGATVRAMVRNVGDAPLTGVTVSIPSLDVVATVDALSPGAERMVELDVTLPRRPGPVGNATATATDRLGRDVTAVADVPLTVGAFTDGSDALDGDDHGDGAAGGSAFTGAAVASPAALTIVLAAIGIVAVLAGRRRARR